MSKIPEARVVRDNPRLAEAPRYVPWGLRWRLYLDWPVQVACIVVIALHVLPLAPAGLSSISVAAFGALMLVPGVLTGARKVRMLRRGVQVMGRVVRVVEGVGRTTPPTLIITLVHEVRGERYETTIQSAFARKLLDDAEEPMVYDPLMPERAMPLDHLPGDPEIRPDGTIDAKQRWPLARFGLPVAAIVVVTAALR